jgi:adenine-specific DNA-methyltransferase
LNRKDYVELIWNGKEQAIKESELPTNKKLITCEEESKDFDTTQNLYIEGDNLDALKLLKKEYQNKIKMIYIDPPYNTGNKFIYADNLSHTDWLNMIYPRLKLARDLLTDDGVIFISIDDNEQANLKKVCDEIFGEGNVDFLIWNKEASGASGTLKQISTTRRIHEYILCVFKNFQNTTFNKIKEPLKGKESELQTANLAVNLDMERKDHPNYFTIINPHGDSFTRQWKWDQNKIKELIKENLIYWGSDGHKQPRLIIPTDERRTTFLLSILNYGGTTIGRKDFEDLFNSNVNFSYPKPIILLMKLVETAAEKNSLILDFFSGSATTAHAVMKLNAEDGGNRKFIMVQLQEECAETSEAYKAGFKNICEIGKERIRRAGQKIKDESPLTTQNLDVGFRVLKIVDKD